MSNFFSALLDRFWCRPAMASLGPRDSIEALRRDYVRAERLVGFARTACETELDADSARVAAALYEMAIDELVRTSPGVRPSNLPSLESAESPALRRELLALCDAGYEEARSALLPKLNAFQAVWIRRVLNVVVALAIVLGTYKGVVSYGRPELTVGKPWRASSASNGFPQSGPSFGSKDRYIDPHSPLLLFHTDNENEPWLEIDLEKPRTIHSAEVVNRSDCCEDRAAPIVFEASDDQKTWRTLDKKDEQFTTWQVKFPKQTARYVRVRLTRKEYLALYGVSVW